MKRGNRLLLAVAGITAVLVLVQFALISEQSAAYFEEGEPLQLEENASEKKAPVFKEVTTLPVLLMHGMGDAAGNGGMMRIQKVGDSDCSTAG
jgi:hypothetical protein